MERGDKSCEVSIRFLHVYNTGSQPWPQVTLEALKHDVSQVFWCS